MKHQPIAGAAEAVPTILVERAALLAGLAFLDNPIVDRRNTIPVLSGVLFQPIGPVERWAEGVPFSIRGTDLDIEATLELAGGNFADARPFVVASAGALLSAVKGCKADDIMMELLSGQVRVSGGGATITLATLPADDFPIIEAGEFPATFELPGLDLAAAWGAVSPAISTEETRYYLNGIYVHTSALCSPAPGAEQCAMIAERSQLTDLLHGPEAPEGTAARIAELTATIEPLEAERRKADTLTFAATDGHRLCVHRQPLPDGAGEMPSSIIPRKCVAAVLKLLGKAKPIPKSVAGIFAAGRKGTLPPDVRLSFSETKVQFQIGRWRIVSKLIDGSFPDYRRVIPTHNDKVLTINGAALAAATLNAAAVANERTRAVKMTVEAGETIFTCTSPENGVGKARAESSFAPVSHFTVGRVASPVAGEGEAETGFEIGFNAAYLAKMGETFGNVPVTLALADAAAPTLFTSEALPGFLAVLMPMRVGAEPDEARNIDAEAEPVAPKEMPRDAFIRVYTAAWASRDKAGLTRASATFREALENNAPDKPAAWAHNQVAYEAATIRVAACDRPADGGGHYAAQRRAEGRLSAINLAERGFVSRSICGGGTRSRGSFSRLAEIEANIAWLASLPGFDPADSARWILPVALSDGKEAFVRLDELQDATAPGFVRHTPKGVEKRRSRGESSLIYRDRILGIVPPKLTANETAAKLYRVERDNAQLLSRLSALEAMIADMASRPAAEPAPAAEMPAPVPEPQPEPIAAPEPPQPTVLGAIIADLAGRLETAEAKLAAQAAGRGRTAARMVRLRGDNAALARRASEAEAALGDARSEAEDANGRASSIAGRLQVAEAELARYRPLAAAIAGLTGAQTLAEPAPPAEPVEMPAAMMAA